MSQTPEELRELVQKYLEGMLSPKEKQRLEVALNSSVEAQKIYVQELKLHSALHLALKGTVQSDTAEHNNVKTISKRKSRRKSRLIRKKKSNPWAAIAGMAAAALLAVFIGFQLVGSKENLPQIIPSKVVEYPKPKTNGKFYTASKTEIDESNPIHRDVPLSTGKEKASVELGSYVSIDVAPESIFTLQGKDKKEVVYLEKGELTCDVNKNVGEFTVKTPVGTVSVQGTKFKVKLIKEDDAMTKKMLVTVLTGAVMVSGAWGQDKLVQGADKTYGNRNGTSVSSPEGRAVKKIKVPDNVVALLKKIKAAFEKNKKITADINGRRPGKYGDGKTTGSVKIVLKNKFWKKVEVSISQRGGKKYEYESIVAFDGKIMWTYNKSGTRDGRLSKSLIDKGMKASIRKKPKLKAQITKMAKGQSTGQLEQHQLENSLTWLRDKDIIKIEENGQAGDVKDGVETYVISKTSDYSFTNKKTGKVYKNITKTVYYFGKKDGVFRKMDQFRNGVLSNTLQWSNVKTNARISSSELRKFPKVKKTNEYTPSFHEEMEGEDGGIRREN